MDYDKNASCRDNGNEQRVQEVLLYYAHDYEAYDSRPMDKSGLCTRLSSIKAGVAQVPRGK